jgi:predicted transcriptional regulator
MKVLLSIKPEFANKIFSGEKKFEFRRTIFKSNNIKSVIVYASSPMQKVIGEFEIEEILNEELDSLWKMTKDFAGIHEDYFYQYFCDKQKGFAIKIKKAKRYRQPLCIKKYFKILPPQSFAYIN